MNEQIFTPPVRKIALTLMKSALALLDHVGDWPAAAALQSAIDVAEENRADGRIA